jgi:hypothetical protein
VTRRPHRTTSSSLTRHGGVSKLLNIGGVPSGRRRRFPQVPARRLKEAYAVRRTVSPSAEIEEQIEVASAAGSQDNAIVRFSRAR